MKMGQGNLNGGIEREGARELQALTHQSRKHRVIVKRPEKRLLSVNTKIKTSAKEEIWCVREHIGSGGFGDVYKVYEIKKPKEEYAMKTEYKGAHRRRLKVEKKILQEIGEYIVANNKKNHFCNFVDAGQTKEYLWIVMTLIGPSLDNVRRMLNRQYTKDCVIKMALQILDVIFLINRANTNSTNELKVIQAVEIMHDVGFVHRDLKPGNICTGDPPEFENILYLLDFGISRRIFKNQAHREIRNRRKRVPFYGTRKFCNRACHMETDQGRKDDMECYVYTILDLFHNEKGLPWSRDQANHRKILEKKNALFENPTKVLHPIIPAFMANIIAHLAKLNYADAVDYMFIRDQFQSFKDPKAVKDSKDEKEEIEKKDEKEKQEKKEDKEKVVTADSVDCMDWSGKLKQMVNEYKKKKNTNGEETLVMDRIIHIKKRDQITSNNAEDRSYAKSRDGEVSETINYTQVTLDVTTPRPMPPNTLKKGGKSPMTPRIPKKKRV